MGGLVGTATVPGRDRPADRGCGLAGAGGAAAGMSGSQEEGSAPAQRATCRHDWRRPAYRTASGVGRQPIAKNCSNLRRFAPATSPFPATPNSASERPQNALSTRRARSVPGPTREIGPCALPGAPASGSARRHGSPRRPFAKSPARRLRRTWRRSAEKRSTAQTPGSPPGGSRLRGWRHRHRLLWLLPQRSPQRTSFANQ